MKINKFILYLISAFLISSCTDDVDESTQGDVGTEQEGFDNQEELLNDIYLFGDLSEAQKSVLPLVPVKTLDEMGNWPSDITMSSKYAFVVDSGNNAIHRIELSTLEVERNYIDLGQNAAPYSAEADEEALYVALQGKNSVIKYPHSNPKESTVILSDLQAPTAIYIRDGNIYVTDSEYNYEEPSKTGGKLYAILKDKGTVVLDTTVQNPGFIEHCPMYDLIMTVNSGIVSFSPDATPPSKSCVDMWKIDEISQDGVNKPKWTFCRENTSLGRTIKSSGIFYAGDGLKSAVHAINMLEVPEGKAEFKTIVLSDESIGMTTPVDLGNQLAVLDFNNDRLYWFDGMKVKSSYKLTESKTSSRGPIDAVYDSEHKHLLILNSTSGSVDVLKKQ